MTLNLKTRAHTHTLKPIYTDKHTDLDNEKMTTGTILDV